MDRPEQRVLAMKIAWLAAVVWIGLGSSALAQSACLMPTQILRWTTLDRKTVIVENLAHQKFKLSLYAPCPGIDFDVTARIESQGVTRLDCVRRGDFILHRGFGFGNRCQIKSAELYTPAMQRADEEAAAAKVKASQ
jgi:hypothetical protein